MGSQAFTVWEAAGLLLPYIGVTLGLFFATLVFSLPLGMLVASARMSRFAPLRGAMSVYISIMRGTPLMLQLVLFYFGPGLLFPGIHLNEFVVATIAFSINYAAYFAEIFRGGLQSIPKGQYEAAAVLGFSKWQTFKLIVLPQLVKRILPALGNESITLVKDTSLAQIISLVELLTRAQQLMSTESTIMPLFVAGVFYYVMNAVVAFAFSKAEKKLSYYHVT